MMSRSRLLVVTLLSALLIAWGTSQAAAGPMYLIQVDTSALGSSGTLPNGSLEFQFVPDPLNPVTTTATLSFFSGATLIGPPTIANGLATGDLTPLNSLNLFNDDGLGQPADVFQDVTFGNHLSFAVSFSGPGTFYLSLWDEDAAGVMTSPTTATQLLSSSDPTGAALVLTVDENGVATVEASGIGVAVSEIPEPSSLALLILAVGGFIGQRWLRRRQIAA